jgi:TatA/E family protein of Tat protein translocase
MVLIGALLILLFGAKKLPQLGDGLGKALRGFQRAMSGADDKPKAPLDKAEAAAPPVETK